MNRLRHLLVALARALPVVALLALCLQAAGARAAVDEGAAGADTRWWSLSGQATWTWQGKPPFPAAYSGPNSLRNDRERSYALTSTVFMGARPWESGELWFNPELAQGLPLSNLAGLGGFTNGELARVSGRQARVYRARLFLRQTWNFGAPGETLETVDADTNQFAARVARRRLVLTAGNLSVLDIFDDNAFSHDPRTQFLNWSLMTHGAYDYAADARGYSQGAALEWFDGDWAVRAGRFAQPREPNQMRLDNAVFSHFGDQLEIEHAHQLAGQPGKLRFLLFRNRARMARFEDALAAGTVPDLNLVRNGEHTKRGWGINLEQALTADLGLFARASRSDGATEVYAFTEIDRSVSGGLVLRGAAWGRPADRLGVGLAQNALSAPHRNYLAAGGLGFFIGDGALSYRPERIGEAFYSIALGKQASFSLDWQRIVNPAYNADRGPVNVWGARLHFEY